MSKQIEHSGFTVPPPRALGTERRHVVLAQLAAIAGLVVSTVVAATVVTVRIAHASIVDGVIDNDGGLFVIALLLGVLFIGLGGFSLLPRSNQRRHRH